MSAIVCDACVMQRFTHSLIRDHQSIVRTLIECIAEHHSFAIDAEGRMEHQWLETCGAQVFGEYLIKWLREGKVELFPGTLAEQHRKHLRIKCGFPFTQRHEGAFVSVAAQAFPHILVGDDLDFWEPKEKGCSAHRRLEIMAGGTGSVCKYLRKNLQVNVVTVEQALPLLCPQAGGLLA